MDKNVVKENYKCKEELLSEELLKAVENSKKELDDYYFKLACAKDPEEYSEKTADMIASYKRSNSNIAKAYKHTARAADELSARHKDLLKGKNRKILPTAPANCVIDLEENRTGYFARGINIYKLFLICFVGSFLGVVLEMLWCLLKNGYIESRAALVFGPFNLLYGVGAVVLTVTLYRFRNSGKFASFFGGMIVGGVVEYLCSFFQELFFGSRSWDYSSKPFNINGRVCLLYCVFWGVLGVLWVKSIYPCLASMMLKIPDRFGKTMTWVLVAFFFANAVITLIAVWRWSARIDGVAASNSFLEFIDARFNDEFMRSVFANMEFN